MWMQSIWNLSLPFDIYMHKNTWLLHLTLNPLTQENGVIQQLISSSLAVLLPSNRNLLLTFWRKCSYFEEKHRLIVLIWLVWLGRQRATISRLSQKTGNGVSRVQKSANNYKGGKKPTVPYNLEFMEPQFVIYKRYIEMNLLQTKKDHRAAYCQTGMKKQGWETVQPRLLTNILAPTDAIQTNQPGLSWPPLGCHH